MPALDRGTMDNAFMYENDSTSKAQHAWHLAIQRSKDASRAALCELIHLYFPDATAVEVFIECDSLEALGDSAGGCAFATFLMPGFKRRMLYEFQPANRSVISCHRDDLMVFAEWSHWQAHQEEWNHPYAARRRRSLSKNRVSPSTKRRTIHAGA